MNILYSLGDFEFLDDPGSILERHLPSILRPVRGFINRVVEDILEDDEILQVAFESSVQVGGVLVGVPLFRGDGGEVQYSTVTKRGRGEPASDALMLIS